MDTVTATNAAAQDVGSLAGEIDALSELSCRLATEQDLESAVQIATETAVKLSGATFGRFEAAVADSDHPALESLLAVPVVSRSGELLGRLLLGHPEPGVFRERTGRVIAGIAAQLALAMDNARLPRSSERRFREVLDALPAAVYTTDAEGRLTHFNPAAEKLLGRVPEAGPVSSGEECVSERPDGSRVSFVPYTAPLRDEAGRVAGGMHVLVDTTERRAVEEALRESEERFRGVFESSAIGVAVTMLDGRFIEANQAFCSITGYTEQELRALDCDTLTHPDDRAGMWRLIGQLVSAEIPTFVLEKRYQRKDGRTIWVQNSVSAMRDAGGRPEHLIVLCEDVTARKQAEEAMRQSEERYRAIIATTPECVKVVSADGTLVHMNESGLGMIGAERPDVVVGKSVYNVIAPEFQDDFRMFNERICGGERGSLEFDIIDLNGRRHHMETHAVPLRQTDGSTVQLAIARDVTERRRAERNTLLLGAIVDSSDDAIVSKDLNGIITSWNRSAERLFGYAAEEVVGKSITIIIPPDRLSEEPEILRRLQRGERVDHFETIRRRKDGTLLNISLTISPVKDARGTIIGASKIARDITDRKRTEQAIQELNEQLTCELSAMVRMQQVSTRLVQADDFTVLLGEIIDAAIEITRADRGSIQLCEEGAFTVVAERGQPAGGQAVQATSLVTRSGQMVGMFSMGYRPERRPGERDLRMLDMLARQAADLIERKRTEAALLESERKFRQLADSMPQIVWTARPDGLVDYFNERWYQFTGFERDRFGQGSWEPLLHPADIARIQDRWRGSIRTGEPFRGEYRFWDRQEQRWRWFMGRALPVRDAAGNIVKWFGTSTDIDDQKHVEDELRRANQDLEQFAYSASHDLQEPLRGIKIYSELLTKRYGASLEGDAREFFDYLRGSASRMEMLVRDLVAYTQVAKLDPPEHYTDANAALRDTLANLNRTIVETRAQVTSDPLPPIRVHQGHLRQLLQNLIDNAIKYRDSGRIPHVHVSAQQQEGHWLFSVADNGIGIEAEYTERIFGLFKRLHTGDRYPGTGIGLAICRRIIDRYHGRIWVESEPGRGSTFLFTMPE